MFTNIGEQIVLHGKNYTDLNFVIWKYSSTLRNTEVTLLIKF